jgi:hypothetical protein
MKKATTNSLKAEDDDMLAEYDFSGAVRGKSYKPLHKGYSVTIHKEDGRDEFFMLAKCSAPAL